jgi:hypothetical protein
MTPEEAVKIVEQLQDWVNESCDYLSNRTPYAAGYKEGIIVAKQIVNSFLNTKIIEVWE